MKRFIRCATASGRALPCCIARVRALGRVGAARRLGQRARLPPSKGINAGRGAQQIAARKRPPPLMARIALPSGIVRRRA
eukprot:7817453-Pyramimonas_sp.AAC.1